MKCPRRFNTIAVWFNIAISIQSILSDGEYTSEQESQQLFRWTLVIEPAIKYKLYANMETETLKGERFKRPQ